MARASIIQTLYRTKEGRLFFEDFETSTWLTDQRWIVRRGDPATSTTTSYDGVRSLKVGDDSPLIERQIGANIGCCVAYIFDDTTQTSSVQQYGVWIDTISDFSERFGAGVDNATSTTNYTVYVNGAAAASSVARTNGWHRVLITYVGGEHKVYIDGTLVGNAAPTTAQSDKLRVGCFNDAEDTGWGYIDVVQLMTSPSITITATDGMFVWLYNIVQVAGIDYRNYLDNQTVTSGTCSFDISGYDNPLTGFFLVTRADGATPYYVSDTRSLWCGDVYLMSEINFDRRVSSFSVTPQVKKNQNESNAGKTEDVFFNSRDIITVTWTDLTEEETRKIRAWWAWAQQGKQYGVAIDNQDTTEIALANAAEGGDTTIRVDDQNGIGIGSKYILRRTDNLHYEDVEVSVITGTTITLTSALINPYREGDLLRSRYFWPRCISEDKMLNLALANPKHNRWTFTHKFREAL